MDSKPDPVKITGDEVMAGTLSGFTDDVLGLSKDIEFVKVPTITPDVIEVLMEAPCPMPATLQDTESKLLVHAVDSH